MNIWRACYAVQATARGGEEDAKTLLNAAFSPQMNALSFDIGAIRDEMVTPSGALRPAPLYLLAQ